jgi:hypothetical protein
LGIRRLHPITLAGQVPPIPALRHDTLDVRHQPEPILGLLESIRLGDQLHGRGVCGEHALEVGSPIPERQICQIRTLTAQHVKREAALAPTR